MPSSDPSLRTLKALHPPAIAPDDHYIRLYIAPFDDSLLKTYLRPSVLSLARNTSFHTLQNFPEKPFGYVELPKMEADKVRKKLNGTILKGKKVKIEEAKPNKSKRKVGEAEEETSAHKSTPTKRPKTKEAQGVLPGIEVEDRRKIKRGWTEPVDQSSKKSRTKEKDEKKNDKESQPSKYTQEPEMLFRTRRHPQSTNDATSEGKNKKTKAKKKEKKSKAILHEFENRKVLPNQPIGTKNDRKSHEYIDGKGWVDSDDNVIEVEKKSRRHKSSTEDLTTKESTSQSKTQVELPATQDESIVIEPEQPTHDQSKAEKRKKREERNAKKAAERTERNDELENETPLSTSNLSSRQDSQNWTASASALETLYKRRGVSSITTPLSLPSSTKTSPMKPPPINTKAGFGFGFTNDNDDDENEAGDQVPPLTPFSREERDIRSIRSAAPTPDTAAIGRRFSFSFMDDEIDDSDDSDDSNDNEIKAKTKDDDVKLDAHESDDDDHTTRKLRGTDDVHADGRDQVEKEESGFSKWFWENRGDNNREWKKRRREALKGKRQRENRRIGRTVV